MNSTSNFQSPISNSNSNFAAFHFQNNLQHIPGSPDWKIYKPNEVVLLWHKGKTVFGPGFKGTQWREIFTPTNSGERPFNDFGLNLDFSYCFLHVSAENSAGIPWRHRSCVLHSLTNSHVVTVIWLLYGVPGIGRFNRLLRVIYNYSP